MVNTSANRANGACLIRNMQFQIQQAHFNRKLHTGYTKCCISALTRIKVGVLTFGQTVGTEIINLNLIR